MVTLDTTDPGLAAARPRARLPAVPARQGHRPVHERPGLPADRGPARDSPGPSRRSPALRTLFQVVRSGASAGRAQAVQKFIQIYSRPSLTWEDAAVPARADEAADPAQGHPPPRRRPPRARRRHGRDRRVQPRRPPGGRRDRHPRRAARRDRGRGRPRAGAARQRHRGGADIFKALALGARAVLLGRPYVHGLAVAGEAGVREVIRNFTADFDLTMGLAGCREVAEIGPECLARVE